MLAAPKLIIAQAVQMGYKIKIRAELQGGVFPNGMVGGQKGAKIHAAHGTVPRP